MMKKIVSILVGAVLAIGIFSACSNEKPKNAPKLADVEIKNFTMPVKGEKIAVLTVKDYGTIKIKLFPEYAPKGVENFEGLIDMKYYDELIFHRVVKDFVIQGGDPKGNGTGGNSIWGEEFDLEPSDSLRHFTGAVAYAHAQGGTNGSQFYIVTSEDAARIPTDESFADLYTNNDKNYPENVKEKYKEVGGQPYLDGDYTVFGQVFEGQDIADKIAQTEVDQNQKPVNQVLIEKIELEEYQG